MSVNTQQIVTLQRLIGRSVIHQGIPCTVIEFLQDIPALVLESSSSRSNLQDNQYGNPGRRVAETFTIPLYDDEDSSRFHPELLQLGLLVGK